MSDLIERLCAARFFYSMMALRAVSSDATDEITTLRQQLEQAEARCAELTELTRKKRERASHGQNSA